MTEVPLLYEVGATLASTRWSSITAPTKLREPRGRVPSGDRERRLLPDREKAKRADFVYVNTGTLEDLDAWVPGVMDEPSKDDGAWVAGLLAVLVIAGVLAELAGSCRRSRRWYSRLVYPLRYETIVRGHAEQYDLDPALVAGVIYAESEFDAKARSGAGAIGLMQLLPTRHEGIAERTGGKTFVVEVLYDPELNVRYGSWYLRHLLDRYGDERPRSLRARGAGERRPLASRRNRDPVSRDAVVRRARSPVRARLRARVRRKRARA